LKIPLDEKITKLSDIPYTISFVIRKRLQIDNLNELPKDKRPPESIIWDGTSQDLDKWIEKMYDKKGDDGIILSLPDIEG